MMLQKIWRFILSFFGEKQNVPAPRSKKDNLYAFKIADGHLPTMLEPEILYVLTEDAVPWEAAMICPCGCGTQLELNLLPDERPRWGYKVTKNGIPTLYPSVNRRIGCKSHFFLRQGKIVWAKSYSDTQEDSL